MSMFPPVAGEPEPAASKAPTSVIATEPSAVIVAVSVNVSLVTTFVVRVAVAATRLSLVPVVVTALAD